MTAALISRFKEALIYLFQPSAGRCRCCWGEAGEEGVCESCSKDLEQLLIRHPLRGHISKYRHEGIARSMVLNLKLHGKLYYAELIAKELSPLVPKESELIVPVPMHISRRIWRGFNQSELIARRLSVITGIPCCEELRRFRRTSSQALSSSAAQRMQNIRGAFRVTGSSRISGKNVLLIDDVVTTGATARECRAVLLAAGACGVNVLSFTSSLLS